MGRGSYLGGSTIIGRGSEWFGYGNTIEHRSRPEKAGKPKKQASPSWGSVSGKKIKQPGRGKRPKTAAEIEEARANKVYRTEAEASAAEEKRQKRIKNIERLRASEQRKLAAIVYVRKRGDDVISTSTLADL